MGYGPFLAGGRAPRLPGAIVAEPRRERKPRAPPMALCELGAWGLSLHAAYGTIKGNHQTNHPNETKNEHSTKAESK